MHAQKLHWAWNIPIHIDTRISIENLPQAALQSWLALNPERKSGKYHQVTPRMMVNYLRHRRTTYDIQLISASVQDGDDKQAIDIIKRRVYAGIAEAYPSLCNECELQLIERGLLPLDEPANIIFSLIEPPSFSQLFGTTLLDRTD